MALDVSYTRVVGGYLCGGTTSPSERLEAYAKGAEGRDKFVKFIKVILEFGLCLAKHLGASKKTQANWKAASDAAGGARDFFGLLNIFAGILPSMATNCRNVNALYAALGNDGQVVGLKGKVSKDPLAQAYTDCHKRMALVEESAKFVAGVGYVGGFGIARPVAWVGKMGAPLGKAAKGVGDSFYVFMFVNHVGATVANGVALARKVATVKHVSRTIESASSDASGEARRKLKREMARQSVVHGMTLFEKALELACDCKKLFGAKIHPVAIGSMGLVVGFVGMIKVWCTTYKAPDEDKY
ncbi:MAG: hypothetical protein ACKVOH_05400 [Chlamydiales bacterium]